MSVRTTKNQYRYQVHILHALQDGPELQRRESPLSERVVRKLRKPFTHMSTDVLEKTVVISHFKLFLHFFCSTPLHLWDGSTCCSVNPTDPRPSALSRLRMIWKRHKTRFFFFYPLRVLLDTKAPLTPPVISAAFLLTPMPVMLIFSQKKRVNFSLTLRCDWCERKCQTHLLPLLWPLKAREKPVNIHKAKWVNPSSPLGCGEITPFFTSFVMYIWVQSPLLLSFFPQFCFFEAQLKECPKSATNAGLRSPGSPGISRWFGTV